MKVILLALNAKFIHSSLALRSIQAYCQDYKKQIKILELSINHYENEIIKRIYKEQPDILGISCYIWNMSLVKSLIPTLKKILPNLTIILGGPEVSYEDEQLINELGIDGIMEGEGEETWKAYLDYRLLGKGKLSEVDGLIYKQDGEIIKNKPRCPMDLEKLPFVYTSFKDLEHKLLYYEASRGCPFNCQYCLSSIEKGVRFVPLERVKEHLSYFLRARVKQVKFVDRTFNANKKYAMAIWEHIMKEDNGFTNFHFEIAAELIDDEMIEALKKARKGLIQFEIGVQSTNHEVLKVIKRPMPFEEIKEIVLKIKAGHNIHQHLDLIAGLPYEDYASFRKSFNDVMSVRPEQFQLGFLKLLKGSGLRANAEKYGLIYKEEPPYEILYTKEMPYDQMLKLHSIEELVERYYNSGRFRCSLEYGFKRLMTPFDFFEAFASFWESRGYDTISHNKMAYYVKLVEFAEEVPQLDANLMRELVRFDALRHEFLVERPLKLETIDQKLFKDKHNQIIKDDAFVEAYLPNLKTLLPRHRFRKVHIEAFGYNVWRAYQTEEYTAIPRLDQPIQIVFDYSKQPVDCFLLKGDTGYDQAGTN